jgi:hypothetical protein
MPMVTVSKDRPYIVIGGHCRIDARVLLLQSIKGRNT